MSRDLRKDERTKKKNHVERELLQDDEVNSLSSISNTCHNILHNIMREMRNFTTIGKNI